MLEVRQLCKSYGGRQVLSPVSFVLPPGQCLGLAGSNGSGKSTLLRLMAQIERPDGGEVLFEGRSVLGDRRFLRSTLGYVPQSAELARELTVGQQLKLWQSACALSGPLPGWVLELLGLERKMEKHEWQAILSTGQKSVCLSICQSVCLYLFMSLFYVCGIYVVWCVWLYVG